MNLRFWIFDFRLSEIMLTIARRAVRYTFWLFLWACQILNLEQGFAQANFYQGKTIALVVASTSGGGYDLWARLTARYIGKYIPGNPTIVVQNMPGAGNIIGANYVYGVAKPDGLTLGAVNPALYFDQLVGRSEVKFDWAKFNWIGSPEKNDVVNYMRADQPIKSVEDWRNAKDAPKCGSTGTGSTGHYIPRLLEETLGVKTQIVSGYPGAPDIELAIERGEVFCWSPLLATYFGREPYRRWHKSGYVRVLVQTGAKRDARLKETPTLNELMQQYKTNDAGRRLAKVILTAATLGRPVGVAPGVPADRVKILRDAYAKALSDPDLLAEAAKQGWEVDATKGDELQALSKEVMNQPKEVIERMKWVLGRE
jgi:tripartite-type tricarboxylate transporter receptor subunit TctC